MSETPDPKTADGRFFDALLAGDLAALDRILADDFLIVDVMRGEVTTKAALLEAIGARQVAFESIVPADRSVRLYGMTAVIVGRTRMAVRFGGASFAVESRYTHVFVRQDGDWRLVAAQGTRIESPIGAAQP